MATNLLPDDYEEKDGEFQFLIGWLQTNGAVGYVKKFIQVSIPYRLATNTEQTMGYLIAHRKVSIPYRLATNSYLKKLNLFSG